MKFFCYENVCPFLPKGIEPRMIRAASGNSERLDIDLHKNGRVTNINIKINVYLIMYAVR